MPRAKTHTVRCWLVRGPRGGRPIVRRTRQGAIAAWVQRTGRIILFDNDFAHFADLLKRKGWKLCRASLTVRWTEP